MRYIMCEVWWLYLIQFKRYGLDANFDQDAQKHSNEENPYTKQTTCAINPKDVQFPERMMELRKVIHRKESILFC